ncbi:MAG: nitrous oxide-stimulated promoter family protein [Candidatus Thorarchaeota archaeon]|nr:nitrous oxide-stimulated promoter family protein [Candidatus Thorarchaeota archaeon]
MNEKGDSHDGLKIAKEKNVVSKMIGLYCEKKHGSQQGILCQECANLREYSHHRLDHCRYGEDKPTCRKCETHCYKPEMRGRIRAVMRFSGPRLVLRAPADWIRHQLHERN